MAKRLFVGKLPYEATSAQLEEVFAQAGKVVSATVITDKFTGQGKGFGFVEMSTDEESENAIRTLNGYSMNGRPIVVNEARPQEDRGNRGGGGGGRGGFGGGRGGFGGGGDRSGGHGGGFDRQKRW